MFFKYVEVVRWFIEFRSVFFDSRKVVKWNVEDIFSWFWKDYLVFKEDYMDCLEYLWR